jgi:hypothetical protein
MHDLEKIAIDRELRPLPGIPVSVVRAQVEAIQTCQQAVVAACMEHDAICAINFSAALSNSVTALTEMTIAPAYDDTRLDEFSARLEALEHVEAP